MKKVYITASFDDMRTLDIRFLNEAADLGELHVLLWSDQVTKNLSGAELKFPYAERFYFVDAMRCVRQVTPVDALSSTDVLPAGMFAPGSIWAVREREATPSQARFCADNGIEHRVIADSQLSGFPALAHERKPLAATGKKKIVVTGCYDWFHTGHVRFFEEVSEYGELLVCVGNDANLLHLKGPGHPQFPQDERRYIVGSVRFVHQSVISTGMGWMDAEPEIQRLKPDVYAVNEDGDKPEKRAFCEKYGLEYLVLKRLPKAGLTRRSSTALRGF